MISSVAALAGCIHTVHFDDRAHAAPLEEARTIKIAVRSVVDRRGSDPRYLYSHGIDSWFAEAPLSQAVKRALSRALGASGFRVVKPSEHPDLVLEGEIDRLVVTEEAPGAKAQLALYVQMLRANDSVPVWTATLSGLAQGPVLSPAAMDRLFPAALNDAVSKLRAEGLDEVVVASREAPSPSPEPQAEAEEEVKATPPEEEEAEPEPEERAPVVAAIGVEHVFSGADVDRLAGYLAGALADVTGWEVVYRTPCEDDACEGPIEKLASAEKHITVDVAWTGDQCEVSASIIEGSGATRTVEPVSAECDADALEAAMDTVAFELRGVHVAAHEPDDAT